MYGFRLACCGVFVAAVLLSGCSNNGDQNSDGGGGSGVLQTFKLTIVNVKGAISSGCLARAGTTWAKQTTTFVNQDGGPENKSCVLAPAFIAAEGKAYWVSGQRFDVALEGTPDADGDAVRHTISTAEDVVALGKFSVAIYPRDKLDKVAELIASLSFEVSEYTPGDAVLTIKVK
jgi:hypothetical protein